MTDLQVRESGGEGFQGSHASTAGSAAATAPDLAPAAASYTVLLVLAWAAVALPLAWGGWIALSEALAFFK